MIQPDDASRLLHMTHQMLAFAEAGAWDELLATGQLREPVMARVFANGVAGHEGLAEEIIALDARIVSLSRGRMQDLSGELQTIRTGSKAQQKYQAVQDMEPDGAGDL